MLVVGSLMFLIFLGYPVGRRASILLLCGGVVALVAGLISQITDQQSFAPLGRRIVNSYKAAALVILNTLILFACLELAATFVAKIWKEPVAVNDDGGENSPRAHTSYYASQAWAKQYWKEFSLSRPMRYHDYVFWRRAPFTGKFININRDGIRLTPGADCSANSYKVFTFGGSTMWGTGSPDWGTVPAYLQIGLKSLTTKPVCVVNFGESAWVSTQSVIQLMLELQSGNVPALVIFYEGANDVYAAYQSGRATHQNLNQLAAKLEQSKSPPPFVTWIESTNSFYLLNRLMAKLKHKPRESTNIINYKTMGIDTATLTDSMVEAYIGNYEIVNALAQKHGFKALFFWQPQIAVGEKSLTNEEQEMKRELDPVVVEFYQSVYHRVQQVAKKYKNLYYIADTFDSANSQIYIDQVHVTPVGNRLIAERIFRVITGRNLLDNKGSSSSHHL
jgi:lysophospholipase L1-like esterase